MPGLLVQGRGEGVRREPVASSLRGAAARCSRELLCLKGSFCCLLQAHRRTEEHRQDEAHCQVPLRPALRHAGERTPGPSTPRPQQTQVRSVPLDALLSRPRARAITPLARATTQRHTPPCQPETLPQLSIYGTPQPRMEEPTPPCLDSEDPFTVTEERGFLPYR